MMLEPEGLGFDGGVAVKGLVMGVIIWKFGVDAWVLIG
jgi:hypothetical protein